MSRPYSITEFMFCLLLLQQTGRYLVQESQDEFIARSLAQNVLASLARQAAQGQILHGMFAEEPLAVLSAVEFDVAFQVPAHHILDLFGRDLLPVETGEDPRVSDGAAPDHDRVTASVLLHTLDIGDGF